MFEQAIIEKIKHYVYFLRDPRSHEVFYVGKGVRNRVFNHVSCAILEEETDKLARIREILQSGQQVEYVILRHGLDEKTAFIVEASMIDYIGLSHLNNVQVGHESDDYGLKTIDEIKAMYNAAPLQTQENVMLININRLYRQDLTLEELYEITRQAWKVGDRRRKAKYAVATYKGITRHVFEIHKWYRVKKRYAFEGVSASEEKQRELSGKSIAHIVKPGASNPIRYINCI